MIYTVYTVPASNRVLLNRNNDRKIRKKKRRTDMISTCAAPVTKPERSSLHTGNQVKKNLEKVSKSDNHEKHTRDFTDRMKSIVTPEELQRQLSSNPKVYFTERRFLNLFRRTDSIGIVWKQFTSLNNDELINQAIFKEVNGNILIDHCMIC